MCSTPIDDSECLTKWLRGLGNLGIFWAKKIRGIEVITQNPLTLLIEWQHSKRSKSAFLSLCHRISRICLDSLRGLVGDKDTDLFIITLSELIQDLYDRWSKIFIYDVDGPFLVPNRGVSVEIYTPEHVSDHIASTIETVQRSSWGFYKPPPKGDYVLVAKISGDKPIGSAYYNPISSNIDYGIHVSKPYWKRRIGTRLLVETARLAMSLGHRWISVVRVMRGIKPTLSDRRAIAFYRANNPKLELNVYRLAIR